MARELQYTCTREYEYSGKRERIKQFALVQVKAAVAALQYMIESAAKYKCDDGVLDLELQQVREREEC